MKEKERLKVAAMATGSAMKAGMNRRVAHQSTAAVADMEVVKSIINDWGSFPRKTAIDTMKKYGPPQEAIPSQLIWYNNGPWKRTRVLRDEIPHHFPQPHTDVLENVINYKVPLGKLDELATFDGSLYVDRTRGEAASRCDMEAANFISLNLMHDIAIGAITAKEARRKHGEITSAYLMNRPAAYAEGLQFETPDGDTRFKDKSRIGGAMLQQGGEKIKEELWRGNRKFALLPVLGFVVLLGLLRERR